MACTPNRGVNVCNEILPSIMHRQQVGPAQAGAAKNDTPPGGSHSNGDIVRNEEEGSTGMY